MHACMFFLHDVLAGGSRLCFVFGIVRVHGREAAALFVRWTGPWIGQAVVVVVSIAA